MHPWFGLVALVWGLLLSACGAPPQVSVATSSITNGSASDRDDVQLLLITRDVGQDTISTICSGSVVGQRTVLTAAHCVYQVASVTFVRNAVFVDPQSSSTSRVQGDIVDIESMTLHPDFVPGEDAPEDAAGGEAPANDLAIVRLASSPGVEPIALAASTPWSGLPATLVGYGESRYRAQDFGQRETAHVVGAVDAQTLRFEGGTADLGNRCSGDSGGPSIVQVGVTAVQIGVGSYIRAPATGICAEGTTSFDMRVDVYLPWIERVSGGDITAMALEQIDPTSAEWSAGDEAPSASEVAGCTVGQSGHGQAGCLWLLLFLLAVHRALIAARR